MAQLKLDMELCLLNKDTDLPLKLWICWLERDFQRLKFKRLSLIQCRWIQHPGEFWRRINLWETGVKLIQRMVRFGFGEDRGKESMWISDRRITTRLHADRRKCMNCGILMRKPLSKAAEAFVKTYLGDVASGKANATENNDNEEWNLSLLVMQKRSLQWPAMPSSASKHVRDE